MKQMIKVARLPKPSISNSKLLDKTPMRFILGLKWQLRWANWKSPIRNVLVYKSQVFDFYLMDDGSMTTKHQNSWKWNRMMSSRCIKNKQVDPLGKHHPDDFIMVNNNFSYFEEIQNWSQQNYYKKYNLSLKTKEVFLRLSSSFFINS